MDLLVLLSDGRALHAPLSCPPVQILTGAPGSPRVLSAAGFVEAWVWEAWPLDIMFLCDFERACFLIHMRDSLI